MKPGRLPVALCLSILLAGCALGELGMYGQAREDYMKSIKPNLHYWEKPGMTVDGRRDDSKECGGPRSDHTGFGPASVKAAQRPGETEKETEARLMQNWQRCMIKQGYLYTGKCYDNKYGRANPGCEGRRLEPLR